MKDVVADADVDAITIADADVVADVIVEADFSVETVAVYGLFLL